MRSSPKNISNVDRLSQALNKCAYMTIVSERSGDKRNSGKFSRKMEVLRKRIISTLNKNATEKLDKNPEIGKKLMRAVKKLDSEIRKMDKAKEISEKLMSAAEELDEILKLAANLAK
ncbi:MAG TPA: hypothetical protein PK821_01470 [Victivallales bacterium]|nr:hypothetical protein [Victivallales bacterium]